MSDFDIAYLMERLRAQVTPQFPEQLFGYVRRIYLEDKEEAARRRALLAEFHDKASIPQDEDFSREALLVVALGISMVQHSARHGHSSTPPTDAPEDLALPLEEIRQRWLNRALDLAAALRRLIANSLVEALCGSTNSAIASRMYDYLAEVLSIEAIPSLPNERLTCRLLLLGENLTRIALRQEPKLYGAEPEPATHSEQLAAEAARLADLETARIAQRATNPVFCCACGTQFIDTATHSFARRCPECTQNERRIPRSGRYCRRCRRQFDAPETLERGLGSIYCTPACKSGGDTK